MYRKKGKLVIMMVLMLGAAILAASCSPAATTAPTQGTTTAATTAGTTSGATTAEATTEATTAEGTTEATTAETTAMMADPFGKYDPEIDLTSVLSYALDTKFADGEDINDNVWTRYYKEELGINLTWNWTADGETAASKMTLDIASGTLPDYFGIGNDNLVSLAENDVILDITDIYDEYASADTKDVLSQDPIGFKSAHVGGRLYGMPPLDSSPGGGYVTFLRKDWLDNLGLEEPKTMDDLLAIARAFKNDDPDMNGADDTFGLAAQKGLFWGWGSLLGIFNGYHAYPGDTLFWIKDPSGKIVPGCIQPEMKDALQALQDLFEEGVIDPEFGVKDGSKVGEDSLSGKLGLSFGIWWNPSWPLFEAKTKDPKSDWRSYTIPSADEKPALAQYNNAANYYIVINKNCKNPEAVVKMMNLWTRILKNPTLENVDKYVFDMEQPDLVYYKYINVFSWEPNGNVNKFVRVNEALKAGSPEGLGFEEALAYEGIKKYEAGDLTLWETYAEFGPYGSMGVVKRIGEDLGLPNIFYGLQTPVMSEKQGSLIKMQNEMITNIIQGAPISDFDVFVADFLALGGNEIIAEVNAWYAENYQ